MTTTESRPTAIFTRPAWATEVIENIDGTVSYIHNGTIEVTEAVGAPQRHKHTFSLEQMVGLDLVDGGDEIHIFAMDAEPVIGLDQMQLDPDGARQLVAALTELIEAYDAAMGTGPVPIDPLTGIPER